MGQLTKTNTEIEDQGSNNIFFQAIEKRVSKHIYWSEPKFNTENEDLNFTSLFSFDQYVIHMSMKKLIPITIDVNKT